MYPITDPNMKAQIEVVFGLTGGELEDKPLRFLGDTRWHDGEPRGEPRRWWARYWYTGSPDYAQEIQRRWNGDVMTIISDESRGLLPDRIQAKGKRWRKIARYVSSGEAECWGDVIPGEKCAICGGTHDGPNSFVYIGDGWSETVYVAR